MRRTMLLLSAAALSVSAPAAAQMSTASWIYAGHVLDRPGLAPKGPSTIVIENGRVSRIEGGFTAPPAGTRLIDLRDAYVLPGLIDSHVHLDSDAGGDAAFVERLSDSAPAKTLRALANGRKTILAGFTTVRNLGDGSGATLALRDAAARGEIDIPRIVDAGRSMSTTSGHMDETLGVAEDLHSAIGQDNLCDGADACRRAVRLQVRRGVDVIKIATTGGVNSRIGAGLGAQMFDDETKAIVNTARLYGKKVAVHAHGADGINLALRLGADSIEHGTLLDDESLRLFRQSRAYYVPTLSTVNGYIERLRTNPAAYSGEVRRKIEWRIQVTGQSLRRAVAAGVRIAFGTDAGVSLHGRNADEFLLMVRHGMTPMTAIEAATVNAADLLGLSAEVGTIEPGKAADIVAVRGDPLSDVGTLRNMTFVMVRGRVHRSEPQGAAPAIPAG